MTTTTIKSGGAWLNRASGTLVTAGDFSIVFAAKWSAAVGGTAPCAFALQGVTGGTASDWVELFQDDASNGNDVEVAYALTTGSVASVVGLNSALVGKWIHFGFSYVAATSVLTIYAILEGFNPGSPTFLFNSSFTVKVPVNNQTLLWNDNSSDFGTGVSIGHFVAGAVALNQAGFLGQAGQRAPTSAINAVANSYFDMSSVSSFTDLGTIGVNFTANANSGGTQFTIDPTQPSTWSAGTAVVVPPRAPQPTLRRPGLNRTLPPFWPPNSLGSFQNAAPSGTSGSGSAALSSFAASGSASVGFVAIGSAALSSFAASGVGVEAIPGPAQARLPLVPGVFNRTQPPFWPPGAIGSFQNATPPSPSFSGSAALSSFAPSGTIVVSFAAIGTAALSSFAPSATAAETFAGSGSAALSSFACTATGSEAFACSGSAARASFATSGAGAEAFAANGSAALSSFASTGSASEAFTSSGSASCSSFGASGSGATGNVFAGSGSAALSSFAASGAGAESFTATGSAACSSFAPSGAGGGGFSCSGSAAESPFGCSGSAATGNVFAGSGAAAMSPFAVSGAGSEAFTSTGSAALSSFACSGAGSAVFSCSGSAARQPFAASGNAAQGTVFTGSGSGALSSFAASGAASESFAASGSAACQSFASSGVAVEKLVGAGLAALSSFACTGTSGLAAPVAGSGSASLSSFGASGAGLDLLPVFCSGSAALAPFAAIGFGVPGSQLIASARCSSRTYDFTIRRRSSRIFKI